MYRYQCESGTGVCAWPVYATEHRTLAFAWVCFRVYADCCRMLFASILLYCDSFSCIHVYFNVPEWLCGLEKILYSFSLFFVSSAVRWRTCVYNPTRHSNIFEIVYKPFTYILHGIKVNEIYVQCWGRCRYKKRKKASNTPSPRARSDETKNEKKKTTEKNAKCLNIQRMPNTRPYAAHTRSLGTFNFLSFRAGAADQILHVTIFTHTRWVRSMFDAEYWRPQLQHRTPI